MNQNEKDRLREAISEVFDKLTKEYKTKMVPVPVVHANIRDMGFKISKEELEEFINGGCV